MRSSFLAARSKFFALNRFGHRFEVTERLEGDDLKPEIGREQARVARFAAEERQVVFEDLDRTKARLGRSGEFVLECATHADRGDRPSEHRQSLWTGLECQESAPLSRLR